MGTLPLHRSHSRPCAPSARRRPECTHAHIDPSICLPVRRSVHRLVRGSVSPPASPVCPPTRPPARPSIAARAAARAAARTAARTRHFLHLRRRRPCGHALHTANLFDLRFHAMLPMPPLKNAMDVTTCIPHNLQLVSRAGMCPRCLQHVCAWHCLARTEVGRRVPLSHWSQPNQATLYFL